MSEKRYLTGMDWLMQALDLQAKDAGLHGNYSQLVLELSPVDDYAFLRGKLAGFLESYPLLSGLPARSLNLCPYWALKKNKPVLHFNVDTAADILQARELVKAYLNVPLPAQTYLVFYLINSEARSFLAMKFDHRLFDARGAELFLAAFNRYYVEGVLAPAELTAEAGLSRWGEKFAAGKTVNRFFLALRRNLGLLNLNKRPVRARVKFVTCHFSAFEFKSIEGKSEEIAGHMMLMPYLLAVSTQALYNQFFAGREGSLIVPVNLDMRKKGSEEIFFNHVSFLFFQLLSREIEDIKTLASVISRKWFDQTKNGIPKALQDASMLLRIMPLSLSAQLLRRFLGGDMAVFSFSCLAESGYAADDFAGSKVYNLFHLPVVPPAPGVGIFFTSYKGGLNLTISYLDGKMTGDEASRLAAYIKDSLF